jgi:hypothetical protein
MGASGLSTGYEIRRDRAALEISYGRKQACARSVSGLTKIGNKPVRTRGNITMAGSRGEGYMGGNPLTNHGFDEE